MDKNTATLSCQNNMWHAKEFADVLKKLKTTTKGLTLAEASKRLQHYGENKLPGHKKATLLEVILHQILNPLIYILIVAAIVSLIIGEETDAVFILLVIIINTFLGTYQEYNAEKSAASLQVLLRVQARVKRDDKEMTIPAENLVPGDIVLLQSGGSVPADLRLIESFNLSIDESLLTGESIAVLKDTQTLKTELAVNERLNMAHAGTTVMSGRGTGVVVETGVQTQVGEIAKDVKESERAKPPLLLRMEKFVNQITFFIIALSVILGVILRMGGMEYATIFFFIVALTVSAIPEGLPVALTVALSIASKKMSRRNVIVRKLTAVESLGSCTVIASDKTGTLTVNEQTAKKIILLDGTSFSVSGEGYNGIGEITDDKNPDNRVELHKENPVYILNTVAVLANEATLNQKGTEWEHLGDAMDVALLAMCYKMGANPDEIRAKYQIISTIPYESENKYSAAFWKTETHVACGVKGSTETLVEFCSSMSMGYTTRPVEKEKILQLAEELAREGYRVLGFAGRNYPAGYTPTEHTELSELIFYGLVCFMDPLRADVKEAVDQCKDAGIKVIMITGDHPATAATISESLGILEKGQEVVTGTMMREAGPADRKQFMNMVTSLKVFARVSSSQKLEIVDALIKSGEFVAVTGDGVNDAPALKRANIGVAMGSGTDVAKEVGSMIVVDDKFSSIVAGVEEGRVAYDNVRKVVFLLISTGVAEILLFIISILAGMPLPLLAVQILWLNLVTNGIQDIALAFEGKEPGAMKKKPRSPGEKVFNPLMIKQTLVSGLTMGILAFIFWYWLIVIQHVNETYARNLVLLLMVFLQNIHVFNCRSETVSLFRIPVKRNYLLFVGVLLAQGIHILCMQIPFMQEVLRVEPITLKEWVEVLLLSLPLIVVMEGFKYFHKK